MRRIAFAALVLVVGCGVTFADTQVRFGIDTAVMISSEPNFEVVRDSFADRSKVMNGLHWEILHDHLGFGGHALVRFDQQPAVAETYQWTMDWDGDLFLSFHLAGIGRLFDPFVELGVGSAGRVYLDDHGDGTWVQDEYGDWHYETDGYPGNEGLVSLSLYPYLAGGLALDLHGLLVGTRVCYRPWNEPVPATQFPTYPLTPVQVTLFGGLALGGHRGGHR
jgi:hypothetical protein